MNCLYFIIAMMMCIASFVGANIFFHLAVHRHPLWAIMAVYCLSNMVGHFWIAHHLFNMKESP